MCWEILTRWRENYLIKSIKNLAGLGSGKFNLAAQKIFYLKKLKKLGGYGSGEKIRKD